MDQPLLSQYRSFLKDTIRKRFNFSTTDQNQGLVPPPIEKPFPPEAKRFDLVQPGGWKNIPDLSLTEAIRKRISHRDYLDQSLKLEELSFLLWATQGIRKQIDQGHAYRTVPSAGCRHALETYLCVLRVEGLEVGVYRYLPQEHQLLFEFNEEFLAEELVRAVFHQPYPGKAAVTFIWTAIPYRMEWRYGLAAHKVIALDAGHVCQNLYLACEAAGCGTCAIAAYDQEALDQLLRLDGEEEFALYLASVGKVGK
ncbi:MAG: SagB/ThcOx family dehydrogenase [Thermodesulfobacteriota bacterium]